jgi:hypothetical protein
MYSFVICTYARANCSYEGVHAYLRAAFMQRSHASVLQHVKSALECVPLHPCKCTHTHDIFLTSSLREHDPTAVLIIRHHELMTYARLAICMHTYLAAQAFDVTEQWMSNEGQHRFVVLSETATTSSSLSMFMHTCDCMCVCACGAQCCAGDEGQPN